LFNFEGTFFVPLQKKNLKPDRVLKEDLQSQAWEGLKIPCQVENVSSKYSGWGKRIA